MRTGEYFKMVGGYHGVVWRRGRWERFDCDGCMMAEGLVHPSDRKQGTLTPKAAEALRGPVFHRHNVKLHTEWLAEGRPLRATQVTKR